MQHQAIIDKRVKVAHDALVRRVKEVPIPSFRNSSSTKSDTTMTVVRSSNEPGVPEIKVISGTAHTSGILLHEELSDGLFQEINNVIDANKLIAESGTDFVLHDRVY